MGLDFEGAGLARQTAVGWQAGGMEAGPAPQSSVQRPQLGEKPAGNAGSRDRVWVTQGLSV